MATTRKKAALQETVSRAKGQEHTNMWVSPIAELEQENTAEEQEHLAMYADILQEDESEEQEETLDKAAARMDMVSISDVTQDDIDSLVIEDTSPSDDTGTLLSDVQETEIEWLWKGFLPVGKLVLLTGAAKVGKSFLMADWMSRVTNGALWPDGTQTPARGVVTVNYEDALEDTLVRRLRECGADLTKIRSIAHVKDNTTKINGVATIRPFQFPEDTARLERAIKQVGAALVIIDPISACCENFENNLKVRHDIISPLTELAARLGVCIVFINHFNNRKYNEDNLRAAMAGARTWGDGVRLMLAVTKSKSAAGVANLTTIGTNLSKEAAMMSYRLVKDTRERTFVQYVNNEHMQVSSSINALNGSDIAVTWKRIMVLLYVRNRACSPQEIAQQLSLPYNSISPTLARMCEQHILVKESRGLYDLLPEKRQPRIEEIENIPLLSETIE